MAYSNGNYTAFYVNEPFNESSLSAHATHDFITYNQLRMWEGADPTFPFIDSHDKNYNVRDSSDWEKTLKPRLHERLNNSKNIILVLSSITKNSRALREEIDYGINALALPVIVIYREYDQIVPTNGELSESIKSLWEKLPIFKNSMVRVPTLHVPMKKNLIIKALNNKNFMVNTMKQPGYYYYSFK